MDTEKFIPYIITTENAYSPEELCPCVLNSIFSVLSVVYIHLRLAKDGYILNPFLIKIQTFIFYRLRPIGATFA
jgi:hypothetical protein